MPQNIFLIISGGLKVIIILGLLVYAIFAAIIVRQEQLMANVLEEKYEPILRLITFIHLIASIAIIFLAFNIL
jgi:hypothetical protein